MEIDQELKQSFEEFEYQQNFTKNPSEIAADHIYLKETKITSLKDVHRFFKKWLYINNTNRIDLMLATHITRTAPGTKVWIIFIGGSGAAKSEILKTLDDTDSKLNSPNTYVIQEITPNTLVSGNPFAKDLAPSLHNKTVLIMDMAILINLKRDDKAKVWAQLRELYDGNARKVTGSPKGDKTYTGLNVTLMACSTGVIDEQILIHQSLGTRELLYRIDPIEEKKEEEFLMQKVIENENNEKLMRYELRTVIQKFLIDRSYKDIPLPSNVLDEIKRLVCYLRVMRASVALDSYNGDVIATVEPESPTRVLKQFTRVYKSLKALDENYPDEKAIEILREITRSSCNLDRIKVFEEMMKHPEDNFSVTEIGQRIRLGKSSVTRHLSSLWNLGLIDRVHTDTINGFDIFKWKINKTHRICIDFLPKQAEVISVQ
jgi:DNA-binding transcriptional ArsR family regulator